VIKVIFGNSYLLETMKGEHHNRAFNERYLKKYFPSVSSLFGFVLTDVFRFMHHSPENRGHMLTTKIVHCAKIRTSDFYVGILALSGNQNF
jgi:hypothetical protein